MQGSESWGSLRRRGALPHLLARADIGRVAVSRFLALRQLTSSAGGRRSSSGRRTPVTKRRAELSCLGLRQAGISAARRRKEAKLCLSNLSLSSIMKIRETLRSKDCRKRARNQLREATQALILTLQMSALHYFFERNRSLCNLRYMRTHITCLGVSNPKLSLPSPRSSFSATVKFRSPLSPPMTRWSSRRRLSV